MQTKFLVLLAIAFTCGMVATFAFISAAKHKGSETSAEVMVQIYVAKENIEGGSKLTPAQFTLVPWPLSRSPEGAIINVEQFDQKYITQNLYVGEPLIDGKITSARDASYGCLGPLPPGAMDRIIEEIIKNRGDHSDSIE